MLKPAGLAGVACWFLLGVVLPGGAGACPAVRPEGWGQILPDGGPWVTCPAAPLGGGLGPALLDERLLGLTGACLPAEPVGTTSAIVCGTESGLPEYRFSRACKAAERCGIAVGVLEETFGAIDAGWAVPRCWLDAREDDFAAECDLGDVWVVAGSMCWMFCGWPAFLI